MLYGYLFDNSYSYILNANFLKPFHLSPIRHRHPKLWEGCWSPSWSGTGLRWMTRQRGYWLLRACFVSYRDRFSVAYIVVFTKLRLCWPFCKRHTGAYGRFPRIPSFRECFDSSSRENMASSSDHMGFIHNSFILHIYNKRTSKKNLYRKSEKVMNNRAFQA